MRLSFHYNARLTGLSPGRQHDDWTTLAEPQIGLVELSEALPPLRPVLFNFRCIHIVRGCFCFIHIDGYTTQKGNYYILLCRMMGRNIFTRKYHHLLEY